jgi:hypothetical protein
MCILDLTVCARAQFRTPASEVVGVAATACEWLAC